MNVLAADDDVHVNGELKVPPAPLSEKVNVSLVVADGVSRERRRRAREAVGRSRERKPARSCPMGTKRSRRSRGRLLRWA